MARILKTRIRSVNGNPLTAEGGGGGEVNTRRPPSENGPWQEWEIEILEDSPPQPQDPK